MNDFGKSWRSGLAFLALIKFLKPDLVDMRQSLTKKPLENLELAFGLARDHLDIPPLLETQGNTSKVTIALLSVNCIDHHCHYC